jgi:SAM-dependent methyltransferase
MFTTDEQLAAYDAFAVHYDRFWARPSCKRLLPLVEKLLLSSLAPHSRVLDLCCGTGRITEYLVGRGFDASGVDGAERMVRVARERAPHVTYRVADVLALSEQSAFDAVVCLYDSLNHLPDLAALTDALTRASRSLVAGGTLLFDLNSAEGFRARWSGGVHIVEPDVVILARSTFDEATRIATMNVCIFEAAGPTWVRSDVRFQQRAFPLDAVLGALHSAGFAKVETFDAKQDLSPHADVGRVFFSCSKANP